MTTPMNDRMKAAMNAMDSARENAGQAVETVKDGAEHAVASTRSAVMDGIHAVTKVLAMVRKLDADGALGWVGLARRRSPLYTFAAFGAGIAVGAGVGLLLAPTSGEKMRAMILGRLMRAEARAKGTIEDAATAAKEVEKNVEHKVAAGVGAAKEALVSKLDAATSGVQEAVHGVQEAAHGVKESADDAKVAVLRSRNGQSYANGRSQNGASRPASPRLRAELEKALRPVEFPKSKGDLVAFASQQAPMEMEIVHALESVPDRVYRSAAEVIEHVTVPAETQQPAQRAR